MKFYTIFFEDMPVYEGKDGDYWLSGSKRFLSIPYYSSKKEALEALDILKTYIKKKGGINLFNENLHKFAVSRFEITKLD
jgi:hypothetical protein